MTTTIPTVFITGANAGLGFEVVKSLLASSKQSYRVLLGGRSFERATEATRILTTEHIPSGSRSTVEPVQVDLSSDESIEKAFETVKSKTDRVDILINNAGGQFDSYAQDGKMGKREMWNLSWDTNVTGTHLLTEAFAPLLLASSDPRLLFITSGTSSIEEASRGLPYTAAKPPAGWPKPRSYEFTAYRASKAGLNMVMVEWKRIFQNDPVKLWAISPGFLATNLAGVGSDKLKSMGAQDPTVGAEFVRDVVEGKRDADVGTVIRRDAPQAW